MLLGFSFKNLINLSLKLSICEILPCFLKKQNQKKYHFSCTIFPFCCELNDLF